MESNILYIKNPELFKQIHPLKNENIDLLTLTFASHKKVWWNCKNGHIFESYVSKRSQGQGCPYCSGKRVCIDNCLAFFRPDLGIQWNYKKNINLKPTEITLYSPQKVWWLCEKGHEWEEKISNRTTKKCGCPYCSGRRKENDQ